MTAYLLSVLTLICIYMMLTVSYDLVFGYAGMFSVSHGAMFGIGAYVGALSMLEFGLPFVVATALGAAAAALVGLVVAVPASRLQGDYLIVGSLSFSTIVYNIMVNWTQVTRGPMGIPGVPTPSILSVEFDTPAKFLTLSVGALVIIAIISARVAYSPFGRVLHAIKDDPLAVEAGGKNVLLRKVQVISLASACAGAAGVFYASYMSFIDPESFAVRTSFLIIVMTVLGGSGTIVGPALGAALIWFVPEVLRFAGLPNNLVGPLNEMAYAGLLIVFLYLNPRGIAGLFKK